MEWIAPLVTALGTVILIPLIQTFMRNRREIKDQEKKDFREDYAAIVKDLQVENRDLRADLRQAVSRIAHLESLCDNEAPYPAWSTGLAGEYRWVNQAFVKQLLDPVNLAVDTVIGKTASEVWCPEVAVKLQTLGPQPGFSFDTKLIGTRFLYQYKLMHGPHPLGVAGIAPLE